MKFSLLALSSYLGLTLAQNSTNFDYNTLNGTFGTAGPHALRYDTGSYGPAVEEFHYFYDQWPIGLAISKTGRVFTCYTRGTYAYTLGEVVNKTAERAYPNLALNTPPEGLFSETNGITFGSNVKDYFISVQALYITPDDTLWVLDTGRPTINETLNPSMPYAAPGGKYPSTLEYLHIYTRQSKHTLTHHRPQTSLHKPNQQLHNPNLHLPPHRPLSRLLPQRPPLRHARERDSRRRRHRLSSRLVQRGPPRLHHGRPGDRRELAAADAASERAARRGRRPELSGHSVLSAAEGSPVGLSAGGLGWA